MVRRPDAAMNSVVKITMWAVVTGALLGVSSAQAKPAPAIPHPGGTSAHVTLASSATPAQRPSPRPEHPTRQRPARHAAHRTMRRASARSSFHATSPRGGAQLVLPGSVRTAAHVKRARARRADTRKPETRGPPRASPRDPLATLPARRDPAPEPRARIDAISLASPAPVAIRAPRRSSPPPTTRDLQSEARARAPPVPHRSRPAAGGA